MSEYDRDGNGKLDAVELKASPALHAASAAVDRDGNGAVTAEEIASRISEWSGNRVALVSFSCSVTASGRPLEGVAVQFIPEKFLSPAVKPASGVSNSAGHVTLSIEEEEFPGLVHCGFYRVELSKKQGGKELIPEEYNVRTKLGEEIFSFKETKNYDIAGR
jgi:hypothetical protein